MNTLYFIFIFIVIYPFLQTTRAMQITKKIPVALYKQTIEKNILLEQGENIKLISPTSEKIWISKPSIILVSAHGSTVNISAKKIGTVLLKIGSDLYKIQIIKNEDKQNIQIINNFLSNRMGLKAHFIKNKIRILGKLYRVKDFIDLSQIAKTFNLNYIFEATITPPLQQGVKNYIYKKILNNNSDFLPFIIYWEPHIIVFLHKNTFTSDFYKTQLEHIGITVQYDNTLLPILPIIELKILLIENDKNYSFQTDINWGETIINRLLDGSLFKQLLLEFKTMENSGKAQILSKTVLLSESGKTSNFHSGGEVPIPYFNPKTGNHSIKWKPYGIQIKFKATADRHNKIHINTQVNISEVDHAYSSRAAPSIKKNRISSAITIDNGQSLLLSKLIRKQSGKNYSAPSFVSRLPLIGSWLSFKGKIKQNTRLNIFITANIKNK